MKIEDVARPGLFALGLAGMAATAVLGFAVGMMAARDPEAARRTARRVMKDAAEGIERIALMAAQAKEHVADLWAEAREEALAEVDAEDVRRAAQGKSGKPDRNEESAADSAKPDSERASTQGARRAPRKPRTAASVKTRRRKVDDAAGN